MNLKRMVMSDRGILVVMLGLTVMLTGCSTTMVPIQVLRNKVMTGTALRRGDTYRKLLSTTMRPQFEMMSMRSVVEQLHDVSDIDFVVTWDEEGIGEGFDPDEKITLNTNDDMPLEVVIDNMLQQSTMDETSWNLGDGYIRLGLEETLARSPERYVVSYPVGWLIDHSPLFRGISEDRKVEIRGYFEGEERRDEEFQKMEAGRIINIITSDIDPLQWEQNGGEGGRIDYYQGVLIVDAADFLHRQIGEYGYGASLVR